MSSLVQGGRHAAHKEIGQRQIHVDALQTVDEPTTAPPALAFFPPGPSLLIFHITAPANNQLAQGMVACSGLTSASLPALAPFPLDSVDWRWLQSTPIGAPLVHDVYQYVRLHLSPQDPGCRAMT